MKGFALGLSLSLAFILGCVSAPFIVRPLSAQNPVGTTRWEVQCAGISALNVDGKLTELGTQAGLEGWELVTVLDGRLVACFKRPLR